MVIITDFPNAESPYWEVEDLGGKKIQLSYDSSDPTGYNRVHVLKQIVNVYECISCCHNKTWKIEGSVFVLS